MSTSIANTRQIVNTLYTGGGLLGRLLAKGRPSICPFHILVDYVPQGSNILDIGCGSGIFLNVLAHKGRISRGIGIDASQPAITKAQEASTRLPHDAGVVFRHHLIETGLPDGVFDVVSMIDVLHHIDPANQQDALVQATTRVAPGGTLLFKDIGAKPLWRAWANRLHDLVLARQWIHYNSPAVIIRWMEEADFILAHKKTINMWWYGHELLVFRRPDDAQDRETI